MTLVCDYHRIAMIKEEARRGNKMVFKTAATMGKCQWDEKCMQPGIWEGTVDIS
jgi:hypothetical protein